MGINNFSFDMKNNEKRSVEISSDDEYEKHYECRNNETKSKESNNTTVHTIFSELTAKNTLPSKILWEKEFAHKISINLIHTNFESSSFNIHYGNFRQLCHILYINLPENIFTSSKTIGMGSFGCVYELELDGKYYAVKSIDKKDGQSKRMEDQFFKEYFLYCLADELGVGPKIFPIFGYDFLISESAVIFSMEKCSSPKIRERECIKGELVKALSIMHSVGFIHLDIKPDNIAFSENMEKHVFLDFGLSRLISAKIGEKVLTPFLGTLNYCSEEMKKCYILREKLLVDLYKNDEFSLEKSLHASTMKSENGLFEKKQAIYWQKKNSQKENPIFMQQLCAIINLKYEIFGNDIDKISKVLSKCSDLPNSCCEILESKKIRKEISREERIAPLLKEMKEKLHKSSSFLSKVDQEISAMINEQACNNVIQNCFPIEGIIQMEKERFIEIFTKSEWVIKLFLFLDPFEEETIRKASDQKWIQRKKVVEKIFDVFASKEQIKLSNELPSFIGLKTDFVLRFFYERMKELKNLRILVSLRMLFIRSMSKFDAELLQIIEQEILCLTVNRDELILRIIEYTLFWQRHYNNLGFLYNRLDEWVEKVLEPSNDYKSDSELKLELILSLVYTQKDLKELAKYASKIGKRQFSIIFLEIMNERNKALADNVWILLMYGIMFEMKYIFDINFWSHSIFYLYSDTERYADMCKPKYILQFESIFIICYDQLSILFRSANKSLFESFDNFVLLHEVIGLNRKLLYWFRGSIIKSSNNLLFIFEIILQLCFQPWSSYQETYDLMLIISEFLEMIEENKGNLEAQNKILLSEKEEIFEKIKGTLSFIKERYAKSTQIKIFLCRMKSIEIQLVLNNNEKKVSLTKELVELIFSDQLSNNNFLGSALEIFWTFSKEIEKDLSFAGNLFQNAYEKFCENLIKIDGISFFAYYSGTLAMLISVKLKANKVEECFSILVKSTECQAYLQYSMGFSTLETLELAYSRFIDASNTLFLLEKYFELISNKISNKDTNFEITFVFLIYIKIRTFLEKGQRISALLMFARMLNKIKYPQFLLIRFRVFDFVLCEELFKNLKQARIFVKKLDLYALTFNFIVSDPWSKIIKTQIERIAELEMKKWLEEKKERYSFVCSMPDQPFIF